MNGLKLRRKGKLKKLGNPYILFFTAICFLAGQSCEILKPIVDVIKETEFSKSAHADKKRKSFVFWEKQGPGEVPVSCARCHSIHGFLDFSDDGVVNRPAAAGVFTCRLCHTDEKKGTLRVFTAVTFPSGAMITNLGHEAICMQCHAFLLGTPCPDTINKTADGMLEDIPNAKLRFVNSHYFAAAANGDWVRGGYQYAAKRDDTGWTARARHFEKHKSCTGCHDPHSLKIRTKRCRTCHTNAAGQKDLKNIRFQGSLIDYDGDGNITEGIYYEVQGVLEKLYKSIRDYAHRVVQIPIGYNENSSPYFFKDINKDGIIDPSEAVPGNRYNAFTPRLLRACCHMQAVKKNPGGFAHGSRYLMELMFNSIQDLSVKNSTAL